MTDTVPAPTTMVPMTIIAGFLGSGKTSLLNHLLTQAEGRRLTALVNDFGALNIDAELIAAHHGNQIALANGCVCCSIGSDFMRALVDILDATPLPDHILVEASGVADPANIAAFAAVDRQLRLDGIVTLVDASAYTLHAQDPHLADNYRRQIDAAHMLLLSKADLVDERQLIALSDALAQHRPNTPQANLVHGRIPVDVVLGLKAETVIAAHPPLADHGLRSWAAHMPAGLSRHQLTARLSELAPHVLRAKGVMHDGQGAYVLHFAGGRFDIHAFEGAPSGHFVLIGTPSLPDDAALRALFHSEAA